MTYSKPEFWKSPFTCPNCYVISNQRWYHVKGEKRKIPNMFKRKHGLNSPFYKVEESIETILFIAECDNCKNPSIWFEKGMLFPYGAAPSPHRDLPEDLVELYKEAAAIANISPRSASALLRLTIEKLCSMYNTEGINLYNKINHLVIKYELPGIIKESLHIVRIFANDSLHSGVLKLEDDLESTLELFELINLIIEYLITNRKRSIP